MQVDGPADMPRTIIEPQFAIEHLSILDADGNLDSRLEPPIPPETLKRLYRAMLLGRRFDDRMLRLQRQGRIGTFAPIKGQEAAQIGSVATLSPSDWMVPSFSSSRATSRGAGRQTVSMTCPSASRSPPSCRTRWGWPTRLSTAATQPW
jgi:hypothetical protein